MIKPKVYVTRILAEEGLKELRKVCDLHIWQEREPMPRDVQYQLFAGCTGLLSTMDIKIDRELSVIYNPNMFCARSRCRVRFVPSESWVNFASRIMRSTGWSFIYP